MMARPAERARPEKTRSPTASGGFGGLPSCGGLCSVAVSDTKLL